MLVGRSAAVTSHVSFGRNKKSTYVPWNPLRICANSWVPKGTNGKFSKIPKKSGEIKRLKAISQLGNAYKFWIEMIFTVSCAGGAGNVMMRAVSAVLASFSSTNKYSL